jgi:hypothetical protein
MASVFKESLSSLGSCFDSDFDAGISSLGVGFDSGFDSGLSEFDTTMVVLLFLLHPPGAYSGKARELAAQALKKKAHWSLLDSKKVGALTL